MNKVFYILSIISASVSGQNIINPPHQPPVQQNNFNSIPQPQINQNVNFHVQQLQNPVNMIENIDENENEEILINKIPEQNVINENKNDNSSSVNNGPPGEEPYCKDCEEIKRLKKLQHDMAQHYSGSYGKTKNHAWKKFCAKQNKKMKKMFSKKKKVKVNYSCFNW